MNIIVGIDGTDDSWRRTAARDARYDVNFARSFVTRLARTGSANTAYWRGPLADGTGLLAARNGAFDHIQAKLNENGGPVLLTGYSRGAAGVVSLASKLQDANIDVEALLLFDCVDRHMWIDADIIPNNVKNVLHVVRDPNSGSRESFDNDGLRYRSPTKIEAYKFMCTHGGMGGCPWTRPQNVKGTALIDEGGVDGMTKISYDEDRRVSDHIWGFIQPFCTKFGFK